MSQNNFDNSDSTSSGEESPETDDEIQVLPGSSTNRDFWDKIVENVMHANKEQLQII